MKEIFETVLILSLFGFVITAVLLLLEPLVLHKLPAKGQYCIWVTVIIFMLVPIYKFIPKQEVQKLNMPIRTEAVYRRNVQTQDIADTPFEPQTMPTENIRKNMTERSDILALIWLLGMCIYIIIVTFCYTRYLFSKHKNSVIIEKSSLLEETKVKLNIKRKIRLKMADDIDSPLLVGLLFPTIYIPARVISDENMQMVFLHELTHYKRKDLIIKWLALFVNAVHWFNPLTYAVCANISEACELSCDMTVTHAMSEDEQRTYMKTILDLAK